MKKNVTQKKTDHNQTDQGLREPEKKEGSKRKKLSKKQKIIQSALIGMAVILFAVGVIMIVQYYYSEAQRQGKVDEMLTEIDQGDFVFRVNPLDFIVEGEDYEDFSEFEEGYEIDEDVDLVAAGVIRINAINLELPLWTTADFVPLRYGAGIYQGSPDIGNEGNLVVLGHRMRTRGRLFNRLDEVDVEDQIIIKTTDGVEYVYEVTQLVPRIDPSELPEYIRQDSAQGKQITLVTCTPVGNGTHRLLVIGHIVE